MQNVYLVSHAQCLLGYMVIFRNTKENFASPCGNCRQIMLEFASKSDYWVIMTKPDGSYKKPMVTATELLPHSFTSTDLQDGQL